MANVGTAAVGQVLQGNGLNASPLFSTATYPSTTNINQILYSSNTNNVSGISTLNNGVLITSNVGVPSMLANGTTGQILTATAGSPPAWATPTPSFQPNASIQLVDDFIAMNDTAEGQVITSTLTWKLISAAGLSASLSTAANPGVLAFPSPNGAGLGSGDQGIFLGNRNNNIYLWLLLGGGTVQVNWVVQVRTLSVASPRYTLRVGLGDTSNADEVNGVYFEYSDNLNSGAWVGKTASASTRTSSNSNVTVSTSYVNLGITINAAASSVTFTVNGTPISGGAITTNIPTTGLTPFLDLVEAVGTVTVSSVLADLFYMTYTPNSAR